jgi:hypothetical protein
MGLKSGRKRWSPSRAGTVNPKTGIAGGRIPIAARGEGAIGMLSRDISTDSNTAPGAVTAA